MSAGYIQLVALGQQDAYLTGEPQVTYFSGVYKRHTPFVLEAYEIPFNGQDVAYGKTGICRIPPKGDLIRGLTLKMNLPPLFNPTNDWIWPTLPSLTNLPTLQFGFSNGAVSSLISSPFDVSFYSSNASVLQSWIYPFNNFVNYNAPYNRFIFSNVANVIVQPGFSSTNAGSPVFWGLDPINYSAQTASGNLIYNATVLPISNLSANSITNLQSNTYVSTLVPDFSLQQAGWFQTTPAAENSLFGLYISLNQPVSFTGSSPQFVNFNSLTPYTNIPYWVLPYQVATNFLISSSGLVQILFPGYYTFRVGFNLSAGAVVSISYGTNTTGTTPVVPEFLYTYTYTVSPNPTSPAIIPVYATTAGTYYYFYVETNIPCNAISGSYFAAIPANDIYQFSNDVTLSDTALAPVPLYGNIGPILNSSVTLDANSMMKFAMSGSYLISGVLSLSNAATEPYVSNIAIGERANILYVYDMTSQGRNPTYGFSIPLVADSNLSYYLNVSSTQTFSNITANSFFTINQVGVLPGTNPALNSNYNGSLLVAAPGTPAGVLDLSTNFTTYSNSSVISVTPSGGLAFANTASYMLTGVFYTTSPVTNVIITNTSTNSNAFFNYTLGTSASPPYTISVPFNVSNTAGTYSVSVVTENPGSFMNGESYIAISVITTKAYGYFNQQYNYYDSAGTIAIARADLRIGGQTVQTLTGDYIEVWNELNVPYENQPGLQLMVGKYDTQTSVPPPGRTYYVNLPFYFYGKPELYLPIAALGRQDVEVWVTFNNFSNLTSISVTNPTLQATIITEYVYLSNPEIDWFQSHQLDYVITQCQYETFSLAQNFRSSIFDLKFKHPVKELFFLIHPDSNLPYNYTTPGSGTDYVNLGMTFNGEDAFLTSTTNTLYLGAIEPFHKHINFFSQPPVLTSQQPNKYGRQFYMYAFSLNPFGTASSGQINFSRIRQKLLELNITNSASNYPSKTFTVIALSQNVLRIENGIAGVMFH
jgi:Large eukaryotic DNA virus major capsid protein/Major capsid protein N-terminus